MTMGSFEEFAKECDAAAKDLRRIPKDLRRAIAHDVKNEVAVPLARKIGAAATGPWARILDPGTKARASADPQIVVGGLSPRVSGGAGPRSVVFGTEFGGGGRRATVRAYRRRTGPVATHKRTTTNQFKNNNRPFVFDTVRANMAWALDQFAEIVIRVMEKKEG